MNKDNEIHREEQTPEMLQPVSVEQTDTPTAKDVSVNVPPGHVYIVALNADGTEKEHSGFFYPEKKYKRFYSDETKYSVKKKVQ